MLLPHCLPSLSQTWKQAELNKQQVLFSISKTGYMCKIVRSGTCAEEPLEPTTLVFTCTDGLTPDVLRLQLVGMKSSGDLKDPPDSIVRFTTYSAELMNSGKANSTSEGGHAVLHIPAKCRLCIIVYCTWFLHGG